MSMLPAAILSASTLSITVGSWRTQMHTYRAEVHEAGEPDGPGVPRAEDVAAIELGRGELGLDTWVSECRIEQRTDQTPIG